VPYLVTEAVNMLGAAIGTTAHFIANTVLLLLLHPDDLSRVREDSSLLRPLLEEALRVESPVQWSGRVATADTELNGVHIPAGSNLLLMWGSANRDAAVFEDPERFWIGRPGVAKAHVAFGYGMHMCLGAPLARLEAETSIELLLARLRNLRLADRATITYLNDRINQRAPKSVPVEFDTA
jgi:cytochrome P450